MSPPGVDVATGICVIRHCSGYHGNVYVYVRLAWIRDYIDLGVTVKYATVGGGKRITGISSRLPW